MARSRIRIAKHPNRLHARRFMVIQDWLDLIAASKKLAVRKMVDMTRDLNRDGLNGRFVKPLGDALYELKARTPEGGARVYFFATADDEFVLCRAECKAQDKADEQLLLDTLDVLESYERKPEILNPRKARRG